MMFNTKNLGSHKILPFIDKNTVGAEIGVWMGDSSVKFQSIGLKELHLIDPYTLSDADRGLSLFKARYASLVGGFDDQAFNIYYEKVYNSVKDKFKNNSEVTLHRTRSVEFWNSIDDNYLDWVYIDGDHSYNGCYYDLIQAAKKVKTGGFIFGDDYKRLDGTHGKGGVNKAVDQFVSEHPQFHFKNLGGGQIKIEVS